MADIFQLSRVLNEKFTEIAGFDSPEIDAAIEDISASQKNQALPKLTTLWEQVSKKADERKINYGRS